MKFIELGGKTLNVDAIAAIVPPVSMLGIPTRALMLSGEWIELAGVPYEDARAALLTQPASEG